MSELPIVERLRAYNRAKPSTIASARGTRTVYPLVNPDGPEAAAHITRLTSALEQLLDDMGEDGLCVCEQAKDEAAATLEALRNGGSND